MSRREGFRREGFKREVTRGEGPGVGASGWAQSGRHPGWPVCLGPVRVAAGEVALRPVRLRDARAWSRMRLRDEEYLRAWEPDAEGSWAQRYGTMSWVAQCTALRAVARRGQALPFTITLDGRLAGQLTVGNVVRGALRSAWIGYWVDSEVAGYGIATAAVALAVDHAFTAVGLHRVEATVRPENVPSLRVLTKLGFRDEGLLVRYLEIDGDWRDHRLLAIIREEVGPGLVARLIREGRVRPGR